MKKSSFVRVDERLIHGQVLHGWVRHLHTRRILVVDRQVAADRLRQHIYASAVPPGIQVMFMSPEDFGASQHLEEDEHTLFLFSSIEQFRLAVGSQPVDCINIGCVQKTRSRKHEFNSIYVSDAELAQLGDIKARGTRVAFQKVPGEKQYIL